MAKQQAPEKDPEYFIPHFARFGYIAKGVTYVLMAFFAGHAALGNGRAANTRRAMSSLDGAFIGHVVLAGIACGLASYALWRFYTAFTDPENDTWMKRVSSIFIGLVNGALAWQAALLAITRRAGSNADQAVEWSAVVMTYPAGILATGIGGVCFAGYGLRQVYRGIISKLDDQMRWHKMGHAPRRSAIIACRIGIAARGIVFVLIGFFLVRAARTADPSQARDFGDSLMELRHQPYGRWLLFMVAAGLLAYAIYEFIRARYRHIPTA